MNYVYFLWLFKELLLHPRNFRGHSPLVQL